MSARPIGSATVSFGLVSVPVKLYSAAESTARVSFNWLHKDCGSRLRQQYVCKQDGDVVERDDMVKGYEFSKGQYVTFTPEELKTLEQKSTDTIDIAEFVPADQVERLYFDKAYYLGPDKGGERAYRLLSRALEETGLSALAKYAARGKQYLVLIRPLDDGLAMEQLHYADEIRPFSQVPLGDGEVKQDELQLAVRLIEQAASDEFRPEAYRDEVRERVLEQIQRKVEGEEITAAPAEEPQTQIIDLMEALKASLAQGGEAADDRKPAKRSSRSTGERTTAEGSSS
ncbi:MAG: Ku protein [Gemmatimonadales bacterium]|jgi:DNA end-binding protein Ku